MLLTDVSFERTSSPATTEDERIRTQFTEPLKETIQRNYIRKMNKDKLGNKIEKWRPDDFRFQQALEAAKIGTVNLGDVMNPPRKR